MNIFMTGATGFLGGRLARELIHRGHNLCVLARTPEKVEAMFSQDERRSITVLAGDLTAPFLGADEDFITNHDRGFDLVLHMAALVKFDEELRDELFETNLTGTKQALALAKALHCPRFFHVSTAYTLGARENGDETLYATDQTFHNPYEESKAHAEQAVWDARHDLAVSIFRPAIIVGDSKTGEADSKFTMYGYMRLSRCSNADSNGKVPLTARSVSLALRRARRTSSRSIMWPTCCWLPSNMLVRTRSTTSRMMPRHVTRRCSST
ncbi:SDR family oxidoreductase [Exiguobacterium aurantiacum]|uniref:SDR family oxidoreductase n=1 Tax=Exiguobacterium aurantiacum TaxID=33987 RepID=A0ABY5FS62_9BACL|nr:SDR family oxidoreductase [Exiguobacterium aurantiacum]UTT44365.1 SDR family oxidoreductase [Exiguobacterium aurantiacum]